MSDLNPGALKGKVALVTGAARRIGAEIATTLHRSGARVVIHYRNSDTDANKLCAQLNASRAASAVSIQADLLCTKSIECLVEAVVDSFGQLDIVVNNASSFYATPLGEITEEIWTDLIGSNLKAPLFLAQAARQLLCETSGNIVNIVDIHARRPLRDHHVYGAAKAGLAMLTRSLAKGLAPNVRVNGIAPGAIAWPEEGMTTEIQDNIIEQIPLGATGDPSDIANAVLFLVTDASYVTGQVLAVDGGRSIGW